MNSRRRRDDTVRAVDLFCGAGGLSWGLDVRFRMLQPRELAAAMGFPEGYDIVGTKTEVTKQIGNAVPVHLATALCEQLLAERDPTLLSYISTGEKSIADGGKREGTSSGPTEKNE